MLKPLLISGMLLFNLAALAQDPQFKDPQNMKVAPQNTDCHDLPTQFASNEEAVKILNETRFYQDQSLRTTRRSGLMQARYLSCDFKTGYLIVRFDGDDTVYPDVKPELWEQLQQTSDIDGYYFKHIKPLAKIKSP